MKRSQVTSSNIIGIGYDNSRQILEIEFVGGAVFQYFDVPEETYQGLITSESVGRHLQTYIKNQYSFSKLSDNSFRELEFITYLSKLINANDEFSHVSLEPSFKDHLNKTLRPDIVCEYRNKKLIIEAKKVAPLTDNRVFDYISQIKRYKFIGNESQLVITFPEELQKNYEEYFKNENIVVWDISTLASIFW